MRRVGHALSTSSDNNRGIASHDGLRTEDDGLHARGADFINSSAHDGFGEASAESTLAGGILTETSGC